jgi:hypothetical protein
MSKNETTEILTMKLLPFLTEYGFKLEKVPQGLGFTKTTGFGAIRFMIQIDSRGGYLFGLMNISIDAIENIFVSLFEKYNSKDDKLRSTISYQDPEVNTTLYALVQKHGTDDLAIDCFKNFFSNNLYPNSVRLGDYKEAFLWIKNQWETNNDYSSVSGSGISLVLRLLALAKLCNDNTLYHEWKQMNIYDEDLVKSHKSGVAFLNEGVAILENLK